jgi:hypothetical protein
MLFVSDVGPEVTLETSGLATQYSNPCVVGPHHGRLKNQFPLHLVQRPEKFGRGFHPIAHSASRNMHAITGQNVFQAVQRQRPTLRVGARAELADDHFRNQPRPGDAAWNRSWRKGSRRNAVLTITASILGPRVDMGF